MVFLKPKLLNKIILFVFSVRSNDIINNNFKKIYKNPPSIDNTNN